MPATITVTNSMTVIQVGENTVQALSERLAAEAARDEAVVSAASLTPTTIHRRVSLFPQSDWFVSGEFLGPYRSDTGATISTPTATVTGNELVITAGFGGTNTPVRFWDMGHRWSGRDRLRIKAKAKLGDTSNTNGVCVALGVGSSFVNFLYSYNGAIGVYNGIGTALQWPGAAIADMAFAVGEVAEIEVTVEPDGSGTLVATSPQGEAYTFPFEGLAVPAKGGEFIVAPAWRRANAGTITDFWAASGGDAEAAPLSNRTTALEEPGAGVSPPSGFGFTDYGFNIRRNVGSGRFTTTFDPRSKWIPTGTKYYVDPANGSDSNAGTTWATAYATVNKALAAANTAAVATTIYLKSGEYAYDNVGTLPSMTVDINLVCPFENPAILTLASTEAGWTTNATYPTVWEKTVSGTAPLWAWDNGNLDEYGEAIPLNVQASLADVSANVNSCFVSGSTIYIKLADGRTPDDDVRISRAQDGWLFGAKAFYFENIQLLGGNARGFYAIGGTAESCLNKCRFSYSYAGNAFRIDRERGNGAHFAYRSTASYSRVLDGFNYHKPSGGSLGPDTVEIECIGHHNGRQSGTTNNGSTTHDGGRIIRVSGDYSFNGQRNIHDVNDDTQSWNLGCVAGSPLTQVGANDSVNFDIGIAGSTSTAKMWLDGCASRGGAVTDFAVNIGATMLVRDTDTSSFKSNVTTGTLAGY